MKNVLLMIHPRIYSCNIRSRPEIPWGAKCIYIAISSHIRGISLEELVRVARRNRCRRVYEMLDLLIKNRYIVSLPLNNYISYPSPSLKWDYIHSRVWSGYNVKYNKKGWVIDSRGTSKS